MTFIAVSQRTMPCPASGEMRDSLDQRWSNYLQAAGLIPILLPNNLTVVQTLLAELPSLVGILLTGGNSSLKRDQVERWLLDFSIEQSLPCLGVCHGMQVMQQYAGIPLNPVKDQISLHAHIHLADRVIERNSYHEFGTTETTPELTVWARSAEGIVKAVRHVRYPWLGIMWHPERIAPFTAEDLALFKGFYHP